MKKIVFMILCLTSIWAAGIKTSYFIGVGYGDLTISNNDDTENYIEAKVGGYFYDKNIYLISNRLYLSGAKILTDNTSFYLSKLNLDWVWNQIPYIKPFVGASAGYLYYAYGTKNYSSGTYGMQAGILIYLGNYVELEFGGNVDHATQNTDVWKDTLKKVYGSINFSF